MHICLISPTIITEDAHWGGIHTHTKLLCNVLSKSGYFITLIVPFYSHGFADKLLKNINIIGLNETLENVNNCSWLKEGSKIIYSLHESSPFSCIISEGNSAYELIKLRDLKNLPLFCFVQIPSFTHIYNNWKAVISLRTFFSYFLKTIPRILYRIFFWEIPLAHSCAKILSVSRLKAMQICKYYFTPVEKIEVVNNWVDINFFAPHIEKKNTGRHKLSISENDIVFLLVGALWLPKGFHIAIKAFKKVSGLCPNSILLVCGEGREEANLIKLVKLMGLENKVRFLGVIRYSELPSIYNAADIFLIPSLMSEGQAYTLIEAMSCGLPVIATRRGGNIETVGDAGILVSPGNVGSLAKAMISLVKSPEVRKRFSSLARKRVVDSFSEEVASMKLKKIFTNLKY
jgi:glycosyltransferase involved in cell wall biosynthesis